VEIIGGLGNHEEEFIDGSVDNLGRCRVHAATLLERCSAKQVGERALAYPVVSTHPHM
jgi:hypothetical protein